MRSAPEQQIFRPNFLSEASGQASGRSRNPVILLVFKPPTTDKSGGLEAAVLSRVGRSSETGKTPDIAVARGIPLGPSLVGAAIGKDLRPPALSASRDPSLLWLGNNLARYDLQPHACWTPVQPNLQAANTPN